MNRRVNIVFGPESLPNHQQPLPSVLRFRGKGPWSDLARWPIGFYVLAKAIPEQKQVCGFGPGVRAFTS
jgi:hypothetical protein